MIRVYATFPARPLVIAIADQRDKLGPTRYLAAEHDVALTKRNKECLSRRSGGWVSTQKESIHNIQLKDAVIDCNGPKFEFPCPIRNRIAELALAGLAVTDELSMLDSGVFTGQR